MYIYIYIYIYCCHSYYRLANVYYTLIYLFINLLGISCIIYNQWQWTVKLSSYAEISELI